MKSFEEKIKKLEDEVRVKAEKLSDEEFEKAVSVFDAVAKDNIGKNPLSDQAFTWMAGVIYKERLRRRQ